MASVGENTRSRLSSELKRRTPQPRRYVLWVRNNGYPASLEIRKLYETLRDAEGERHGLMRVNDESAEDYLYPREFFIPITLPKAAENALTAPSES
jgi:hypothetical protein